MAKRPIFSSRLATLLTMIGVAVGLGNVWRFPYMMGKYGGSAFLFIYLLFTVLFSVPALMAEMSLGRLTRKGPLGAFREAFGTTIGTIIGWMLLITITIAASYYVIIIANVIYAAWFSAVHGFTTDNLSIYETQLNNGRLQYSISLALILGSLFAVYRGLNKGIEWVSQIFVPFFLMVILYLIANAFSLEGAGPQFLKFLQPDFAALEATHIFAALGQAVYSLSLGGTFMLMYGSYLSNQAKIPQLALLTSIGDVGAALLTSLFIIPTILVFGLDMTAGPKLIFSTMPRLFVELPGGPFIGTLFLVVLAMVAILSLIASYEVIVGSVPDFTNSNWSRNKIIIGIGLLQAVLAFPSAFDANLIGTLDLIFGSGMQLLGCTMAVVALTWGLGKTKTLDSIFGSSSSRLQLFFYYWLRWVIPSILLLVLFGYIYH